MSFVLTVEINQIRFSRLDFFNDLKSSKLEAENTSMNLADISKNSLIFTSSA
jgi:hypothetical protein